MKSNTFHMNLINSFFRIANIFDEFLRRVNTLSQIGFFPFKCQITPVLLSIFFTH